MLTFGKRDFTFVQVSDVPNEDGVRISGVISIITNRLPRMRGYTRAFQNSIAFYEELSEDMGTLPTDVQLLCTLYLLHFSPTQAWCVWA